MIKLKGLIREAVDKKDIWFAQYYDYDVQAPHDMIGFTRAADEKEARKSLGVGTGNRFNGTEIRVKRMDALSFKGTSRYYKEEATNSIKALQKMLKSMSSI